MTTAACTSQSTPWYAVQTRAKWERPSAAMLQEKGYEVFYPSRNNGPKEQPLFPSYLFCRASSDNVGRIVTTPGVVRLLGTPGKPESVPDEEIATVRRMMSAELPVQAGFGIKVGDRVRICRGPLEGLEGDVVADAGEQRIAISLCLLQRFISVTLDPSWLQPSAGTAAPALV